MVQQRTGQRLRQIWPALGRRRHYVELSFPSIDREETHGYIEESTSKETSGKEGASQEAPGEDDGESKDSEHRAEGKEEGLGGLTKMNLEDYRKDYYGFSAKASELSRQLSFAGIALIWVFRFENGGPLAVPAPLLLPALLFCAALALDLLHAVLGTLIWGAFARYHERKGTSDDGEIDSPAYFNWPTLLCFWGKVVAVALAYAFLFKYVLSLLQAP